MSRPQSRPWILGIDPGPRTCGVVGVELIGAQLRVTDAWARYQTRELLGDIRSNLGAEVVLVEGVSPRAQRLGRDTLETIVLAARLAEASAGELIERDLVRRAILGSDWSKPGSDARIRTLLLEHVGPKGTKSDPGPTYGVSSHAWQALAVVAARYHPSFKETLAAFRAYDGLSPRT